MPGIARLLVKKFNKKTLKTPRAEVFNCEQMFGVVDVTGGSRFTYRQGDMSIPKLYQVEQTTSQIKALCNACCSSTSG